MKRLSVILGMLLFTSCEVPGELTQTSDNPTLISPVAVLLYSGDFVPTSGISVSGKANIVSENEQFKLELTDFSVSDGPDLKVYLSTSAFPNEFVTLGNLTHARVYNIPNTVDLNQYNHVLIHCQQYNHLFAIAALTPN